MITSAQNTQVKNVIKLNQKAKARREQGLFIAEGRKMFLEAPDDWIEKVYVAESLLDDEEIMQKAKRFSWDAVENSVFRQMSDTQTPQGVLTVLRQPSYQMEDLLKQESPLLMVLEDLQDPGNAGTASEVFFLQKPVWISLIQKLFVQQWDLFTEFLFST